MPDHNPQSKKLPQKSLFIQAIYSARPALPLHSMRREVVLRNLLLEAVQTTGEQLSTDLTKNTNR